RAGDGHGLVAVPLGVERVRGWIGVEARGNLELSAGTVADATPVDVRTLPPAILGVTDQPLVLGYKYLGAKPAVALVAAEHPEVEVLVTLLDRTAARTTWNREGRRLTSVRYQIRNNRRQFLKLALPKGAELWSTSVAGRAVQPARAPDGRVMVPLVRSQQEGDALASYELEVVYVENGPGADARGRGEFSAAIPVVDVPSTYVSWIVYSPDGTKIRRRTVDGTLERVDELSEPVELQPPAPGPQQDEVLPDRDDQGESDKKAEYDAEEITNQQMPAQQMLPPPPPAAPSTSAVEPGAAPVLVTLPIQGTPTYFEKTLALDGPLTVEFRYRGLERKR
ncbi:MAG TPA: hypothetical protein PLU22_26950, partial [Polyangiaceae bacterium]|nr:hypothetical protein [Polyangiaceae bacterium]